MSLQTPEFRAAVEKLLGELSPGDCDDEGDYFLAMRLHGLPLGLDLWSSMYLTPEGEVLWAEDPYTVKSYEENRAAALRLAAEMYPSLAPFIMSALKLGLIPTKKEIIPEPVRPIICAKPKTSIDTPEFRAAVEKLVEEVYRGDCADLEEYQLAKHLHALPLGSELGSYAFLTADGEVLWADDPRTVKHDEANADAALMSAAVRYPSLTPFIFSALNLGVVPRDTESK